MKDHNRVLAEVFGTFWLVLGGCGTAVLAGNGVGTLGISLAFGLTVLTMAYAVGHVSGGHFNPAVTLGLWAGGRFPARDVLPYWVAQVVGAVLATGLLALIAGGNGEWHGSLASNGFDAHSPGHYTMMAAFITEVVMTAMFLVVIMGATHGNAAGALAPVAIGLALTLIHLISIPVTNTSVNPARSIGPALFEGGVALQQLWLFIVAPLLGGALGGWLYRKLIAE
ncbi:MAG: aquaporin Z [Proteobacteria bacterium]|nr:aquaporin Z [Pseudomonadota bacterium]